MATGAPLAPPEPRARERDTLAFCSNGQKALYRNRPRGRRWRLFMACGTTSACQFGVEATLRGRATPRDAMRCDAMRFARKLLRRQSTDDCVRATVVLTLVPLILLKARQCPKWRAWRQSDDVQNGGGRVCVCWLENARRYARQYGTINWFIIRDRLYVGHSERVLGPRRPSQERERERHPCVLFQWPKSALSKSTT